MRAKARRGRDLIRTYTEDVACFADPRLIAFFAALMLPDVRDGMDELSETSDAELTGMRRSQLYRARRAREAAAVESLLQAHAAGRLVFREVP